MISNDLKNQIISHYKKTFPKECCGFIVEDKSNNICCLALENQSEENDYFIIDPVDYLNIKNSFNIKYLYHTHQNENNFSKLDLKCAENLMIDLILYTLDSNIFKIYKYKEKDILYG